VKRGFETQNQYPQTHEKNIMKIQFNLGPVDRFFLAPVYLRTGLLESFSVTNWLIVTCLKLKPVLLKKQLRNQFYQKYFIFNLNFGSFIDIFLVFSLP